MIFAVDFDGTIVEHKYPSIGKLLPYAKEVINLLHEEGHKIIIWTCRHKHEDILAATEFLKHSGIWFDKINANVEETGFNSLPKIYADVYIDDRGIYMEGCINWLQIKLYLEARNII
jgi:hypothetical protein